MEKKEELAQQAGKLALFAAETVLRGKRGAVTVITTIFDDDGSEASHVSSTIQNPQHLMEYLRHITAAQDFAGEQP